MGKSKSSKLGTRNTEVYLFVQGVFEIRAEILTTSYWLHVELGKNI
jgi:hypothetical protein